MKTLRIFSLAALLMAFSMAANAQAKTETFKVSGNCGMCKSKIEKAAKEAGAKSATWDADSKILTVTYTSSSTNTARIQEKIASVGYDNAGATATTEAYDKLHACCKYERATVVNEAKADCCKKDGEKMSARMNGSDGDCCKKDGEKMTARMTGSDGDCCKDGKCKKDGEKMDCCKKDGEKMPARMTGSDGDCCKDGKCTKEGHDGKDCCKKAER